MSHYQRKDEEICIVDGQPFVTLDKTIVLQETKTFNETPVQVKKCCSILAKVIYMIHTGEILATREATECFFAITKLFQNKGNIISNTGNT